MNHIPVTQGQAADFFKEALGALSWWAYQDVLAGATADIGDDPRYGSNLQPGEDQQLVKSLTPALYNAIGVFVFVYPYERYKKECARAIDAAHPAGQPPLSQRQLAEASQTAASATFAADHWADRAGFENTFPQSQVVTWQAPHNAFQSWAVDCVRNSFAHAQSKMISVNGAIKMEIWNSVNGNPQHANFRVQMRPEDFLKMTKDCIDAFVNNAVAQGSYQPLQRLMTGFI